VHTNTRILASEFEYVQPGTLEEALSFLSKNGSETKVLAGGTDVIVKMKTDNLGVKYLLEIKKLNELSHVTEKEGGLQIGAATLLSTIEKSEIIREKYAVLYEAVKSMASITLRNMATVGGNLCNAAPPADTIPPLLVLDASLILSSAKGERKLSVSDFVVDVEKTALREDELLTAIDIPAPSFGSISAFYKLGRISADIARINMAINIVCHQQNKTVQEAKAALGAVGRTAFRCKGVEEFLIDRKPDSSTAEELEEKFAREIEDSIPGRHSLPFKREAVKGMVDAIIPKLFS